MVDSVRKPGVEITQRITTNSPTISAPNLVPCVVGPAFEVVELLDQNGSLTTDSKLKDSQGNDITYQQISKSVEVIDFPTSKADSTQMSVLSDEVQVALSNGKKYDILPIRPSSAFLAYANFSYKAGVFLYGAPNNYAVSFNVAVDVISRTQVVSDKLLNISVNLASYADLAEAINTEMGFEFAHAIQLNVPNLGPTDGILLLSQRYGAGSSVTLRFQSGGNNANHIAWGLAAKTYRVEGSGFKTQDESANNVTVSPYIVYSRGKFFNADDISAISGDADSYLGQGKILPIWVTGSVDATDVSNIEITRPSAVTFTSGGSQRDIPLKGATRFANGDLFFANGPFGSSVSGVQVAQVEANRFNLVTVDTANSVYDAQGNIVDQRYLDFKLGELTSPNPFGPKNAFFRAQNINSVNETSTFAEVSIEIDTGAFGYIAPTGGSISLVLKNVDQAILGADGLELKLLLTNGDVIGNEYTFTAGPNYANVAALITAISDALVADGVTDFVISSVNGNANALNIKTVLKGASISLQVRGSLLALFESLNGVDYTAADILTDEGNDETIPDLAGETISLFFNGNDKSVDILATTDSLDAFVARINETVGAVVSTITESNGDRFFNLRTYLRGMAGSIKVSDFSPLGILDKPIAYGTGRPDPDLLVYSDGAILIGAEALRNSITGQPLKNIRAGIHISYRALRLDLSPIANEPGLIKVSSIADLDSIYGPVSTKNPLALGIYYALINAGNGVEISAIGVSDISSAEPNGTAESYLEALEFLRSYEVYAIAPLTPSEQVIELVDAHVKDMSLPTNRKERIVISAPVNPDRFLPLVVSSGDEAQSTGNEDQIDLNATPEAVLANQGVSTDGTIPFQLADGRQLFVSMKFGDFTQNYSVSSVDGARIAIRRSFTGSQNADGFYSTDPMPAVFVNTTYSLQLRGRKLTLPGSTKLDKTSYAETIRDRAQQYANRRQLRLYPETVQTVLEGTEVRVGSYYFAAALAGACAVVAPQEPFTRRKLLGFTNVVGPALENTQLDIISAGNAVIDIESVGETPALRLQGTTDPTSIETREWSITRAVDYFAKTLRNALRKRIGLFNITQAYVDDLSTLLDGACVSAVANGLFLSAAVTKLVQDKLQPDTLLVEIQVEVFYPANYIKLTIAI